MRVLTLPLALLAAAWFAAAPLAQCPEPSDLDVEPSGVPLLVTKGDGDLLRLTWETVLADGYRLHRGRLDHLIAERSYDHRVVAESLAPELTVDPGPDDAYFLVNSDCPASDSGVGRDSNGVERPWGGLLLVAVGLQGGADVFGAQFVLHHPESLTFTANEDVERVGPYASGAPGNPFGVINANLGGEVRAAMLFGRFDPDPSFDPPPDSPVDVLEVIFGYHGPAPPIGDFTVSGCSTTDFNGNPLPGVSCLVSHYEVLF